VVVLSGPSGVGKSSFVEQLLAADLNLEYSVSATTRPRRPHETDGREYLFLSREEFQRRIDAGEFVEWAEVHGEQYGTLRGEIERRLAKGRNVLLDIDVQGGMAVRHVYEDGVFIFVLPPSLASLRTGCAAGAPIPTSGSGSVWRMRAGRSSSGKRMITPW